MSKIKMTTQEVEMEMQKARETRMIDGELVPFTNGIEKSAIKDAVENAKKTGRIGDKILLAINPLYIHMPWWQRDLRVASASEISHNYNSSKWDVPKVYLYNGKLYCGDGQHRIYGAFLGGIEVVVVELLEITEKEAIRLFLDQTKDRTNMSPADYYKAAIAAEIPEYITFRKICKKNNVSIVCDEKLVDNPVGIWTAITDGTRMNPKLLNQILVLLGKLQWNGSTIVRGRAYSSKTVRALQRLYAYYEADDMENALLTHCKGSEFYNANLHVKQMEAIFDYLSDVIGRELKLEEVKSYNGKTSRKIRNIS